MDDIATLRKAIASQWFWSAPDAGFAVYVFAALGVPVPFACGSLRIPPSERARLEEGPVLAFAGYALTCEAEQADDDVQQRWAAAFARVVRRAPFPADRASYAYDPYELLGVCLGAVRCASVNGEDLKRLRQVVAAAEDRYSDASAFSQLLGLFASHVVSQPWINFTLDAATLDTDERCLCLWLRCVVPQLRSAVGPVTPPNRNELIPRGGEDGDVTTDAGRWALRYAALQSAVSEESVADSAVKHEPVESAVTSPGLTVLSIATEWSSSHGGLSSFNRQLCIHLARARHRVICVVLRVSPDDFHAAEAAGVELVVAPPLPGIDETARLLQRLNLGTGIYPDIVVGHGRVTGAAARAICDAQFPRAARVHFVHVAPGAIEWYKPVVGGDTAERANERELIEFELARGAAVVAAVGPLLHREFSNLLHPLGVPVIEFTPGLPDGLAPGPLPPGCQCLLLGRAEDARLKGVDIAGAAFARLYRDRPDLHAILVIRGAPPGRGDALHTMVQSVAGVPKAAIRVKPFSSNAEEIAHDLLRSSVVLMPSHSEGFGLVGLEAIAAGVPVLLSASSGLGELLRAVAPSEARHHVVEVIDDELRDAQLWGERLVYLLADREAAFARVRRLRLVLEQTVRWDLAIGRMVEAATQQNE